MTETNIEAGFNPTNPPPVASWLNKLLTPAPIAVLVLGVICMTLGLSYAYLYFTRIQPRSSRRHQYTDRCTQEDDGSACVATHVLLFRRS